MSTRLTGWSVPVTSSESNKYLFTQQTDEFMKVGSIVTVSPTTYSGTSLVVQWLRLCAPKAAGPGSIPGQGTRSRMPQLKDPHAAIKKQTNKKIPHAAMKISHTAKKIPHAATKTQRSQINK